MTLDKMIAVLQAAKAGKVIESRERGSEAEWYPIPNPRWDFEKREYRVKPESEPEIPTPAEVVSACLLYRHDYGLLSEERQRWLRYEARDWFWAWAKNLRPEKKGGK